ncbi:hypothetical protein EYC84_002019 [Monilinia fructicola]|uniref:Uncharacterized protein n=1 Tax=Monilinia fructicola TaxID=38448 RepID=A0A5M9JRG5_MONFR|nr:hypothetical protein EYC84_002019 [Monilinia fructicola]
MHVLFLLIAALSQTLAFNAPSGVSTWCGKPYMSTNHSLDIQGGNSKSDKDGTFIIDASISHIFGGSYKNASYNTPGSNIRSPFTTLDIEIYNEELGALIATNEVPVNSTGNLIKFAFSSFPARIEPYTISVLATSPDRQQSYTATTPVFTYFPYAALGFNTINIVPDGGLPDQSYPTEQLVEYWNKLDELNLFNLYDMRFAFQNSTRISEQVNLWKNRTTLLSWYTADEPDGWAYQLNSTSLSYAQLKSLDPYHPRIDLMTFKTIKANIGPGSQGGLRKPTWSVVQAFGEQQYWKRTPSAKEVEVMMMLSVNHNAKGITYWIYPSTDSVNSGSGVLGKVLQSAPAIDFLSGTNAIKGGGTEHLDVSAWILEDRMMVGIVNGDYIDSKNEVTINLPAYVTSLNQTLYGGSNWTVSEGKVSKLGLKGLEIDILVVNITV